MTLIYSEEQIKTFHALLKPLEKDEVYFISMSGRNKYLSPEERLTYNLGRSEMMGRKIVKSNDVLDYIKVIRSSEHSWFGKKGEELPNKCLMCYANINNSSGKQALKEFYIKTNEYLFNLDSNLSSYENFRYLDTELMNCYQKARANRKWIDIDIDSPDREFSISLVEDLKEALNVYSPNIELHTIETHSGFHVLLNKSTINFNYNPVIDSLHQIAINRFEEKAEVCKNINDMIPIPGTLQGGFEVKFI